jgi:hypothetical protein
MDAFTRRRARCKLFVGEEQHMSHDQGASSSGSVQGVTPLDTCGLKYAYSQVMRTVTQKSPYSH